MRSIMLCLAVILATGLLAAQDFEVTGIAVCKGVQDRACLEPVESVPADTPSLFCLVTLKAARAGTLTHRWTANGTALLELEVPVKFPSPLYRQWSEKNLRGVKGDWTVEVLDEEGTVLKSVAFQVE